MFEIFQESALLSRMGSSFNALCISDGVEDQSFVFVDGATIESHTFISLLMIAVNANVFATGDEHERFDEGILNVWKQTSVPSHFMAMFQDNLKIYMLIVNSIRESLAEMEGDSGRNKTINAITQVFENLREASEQKKRVFNLLKAVRKTSPDEWS